MRLLFKDGSQYYRCNYNIIENHLCNQHSGQWALYHALESSFECASFFNDVPVVLKSSCRSHASKTYIVHEAIPALINANQHFLLNKAFIWPLPKLTIPDVPKSS